MPTLPNRIQTSLYRCIGWYKESWNVSKIEITNASCYWYKKWPHCTVYYISWNIYLHNYLSIHLSVHPSNNPSNHSSNHKFISSSIHPFIHSSIHPLPIFISTNITLIPSAIVFLVAALSIQCIRVVDIYTHIPEITCCNGWQTWRQLHLCIIGACYSMLHIQCVVACGIHI